MKDKEQAFADFCEMIRNSWTFEKMTLMEQANCYEALQFAHDQHILKGSYNVRWMILHAVYHSFLCGLGYTGGASWRDGDDAPQF